MKITAKHLPKSIVEFTIEIPANEQEPYLLAAGKRLAAHATIAGFRKGNAPFEVVKAKLGEAKIMEEAVEEIVHAGLAQGLAQEGVEPAGSPAVDIITMVPGSPLVVRVSIIKFPKIIKLPDYRSITVTQKPAAVSEEAVAKTLTELRKLQTREERIERPAQGADKVVVNMDMSAEGVPLDGGQARDHAILLGEPSYIPGLTEALVGIAPSETRTFKLPFPKDHYQQHLAGKEVDFKVTATAVYELRTPAEDDAFAKALGKESLAELRALIRKNLETEARGREDERAEIEILESIVNSSQFEELPEIIVNTEVHRMLQELEESIRAQGLDFSQYLQQIGKTLPQLKLDFVPRALQRVKTALVIREVAVRETIEPTEEEVVAEALRLASVYSKEPDMQARIKSEEGRAYIRGTLRNRKVIEFLKGAVRRAPEKSKSP